MQCCCGDISDFGLERAIQTTGLPPMLTMMPPSMGSSSVHSLVTGTVFQMLPISKSPGSSSTCIQGMTSDQLLHSFPFTAMQSRPTKVCIDLFWLPGARQEMQGLGEIGIQGEDKAGGAHLLSRGNLQTDVAGAQVEEGQHVHICMSMQARRQVLNVLWQGWVGVGSQDAAVCQVRSDPA